MLFLLNNLHPKSCFNYYMCFCIIIIYATVRTLSEHHIFAFAVSSNIFLRAFAIEVIVVPMTCTAVLARLLQAGFRHNCNYINSHLTSCSNSNNISQNTYEKHIYICQVNNKSYDMMYNHEEIWKVVDMKIYTYMCLSCDNVFSIKLVVMLK